jgi:hypothetical protein
MSHREVAHRMIPYVGKGRRLAPDQSGSLIAPGVVARARRRAVRLTVVLLPIALAMAVATLVLAEAALRVVPGLMPAHAANRARLFQDLAAVRTLPHREIGFLYPPRAKLTMRHQDAAFSFRTDSRGFRNAGPWPKRADVVALGDSVTFGFGVPHDQSWVARAASMLGTTSVNLALPGFGPLQHLRVYEAFGAALHPRLVLVGFFPANDFWDTGKFLKWLTLPERGDYMLWRDFGVNESGGRSAVEKVVKSSYLASLVWAVATARSEVYGRGAIVHDTPGGRLLLVPGAVQQMADAAAPDRPEFVEVFRALKRLDERVRADGGELVVVLVPSKEHVYLPLRGMMPDDPLAHVYRALDELGTSSLDLTPHFRARAAAGEQLFFEMDGHPNARGNELTADVVVDYLRRRGTAVGRTGRTP